MGNMSLCSDGLSSDQYFLVNFVMSNYLGPDVYSDNPRCSASQRLAKSLPPYTLNHIGPSSLTVVQLQSLYYYVLRNANSSLLLHPDMIYMYLKGYLPLEPVGEFSQFTYFFPTNLHPQKRYSPSHEIVKGIAVIDDPAVAFISNEELQRFRCLSRLDDLKIDRVLSLSPQRLQLDETRETEQDCARNREEKSNGLLTVTSLSPRRVQLDETRGTDQDCSLNGEEKSNGLLTVASLSPQHVQLDETRGTEQDHSRNGEAKSNGLVTNLDFTSSGELQETCERKKEEEAVAGHAVCVISKNPESQGTEEECSRNDEATSDEIVSDQDCNSSAEPRETCKRKKEEEESFADHAACGISKTPERFRETYKRKRFKKSSTKATNKNGEPAMARDKSDHHRSFALVPFLPEMKECDTEPSVITKGTASKGALGPSVGVVDIGVNKVAYFFQVALPGVLKGHGMFMLCSI